MLAQFSGGLLTDRIGRRNTIAISMITSASLVLLLLEARSLLAVMSVVIVYAFFAGLHRPASGALIRIWFLPEHRVAAYAFNRLLFGLSFATPRARRAPGERTLQRALHRRRRHLGDLRRDLTRRAPPWHPQPRSSGPEIGSARATILADKGFLLVLGAILAGGLVYAQGYSTFPLWVRDLGFPERVYGFLQGGNGLLVAIFELGVTAIASDTHGVRMIALGILLTGLGFGAFGIFLTQIGMAGAVVVWTFGEMFGSPSTAAFIADRAPAHLRGRYQSSLDHLFARIHDRADRRHGDLRMVAPRALDRLRGIGSARGRPRPRRRAISRTHPCRATSRLTVLLSWGIYRTDIPGRYIGCYDEGTSQHARTRGPGPAQGAAHARLPALP